MTLLIVLVFLLVITSLTLYSARYAVVNESASRNQMANEMARQAAEAALRDAERDLLMAGPINPPHARCQRSAFQFNRISPLHWTFDCHLGQCTPTDINQARHWNDTAKAEPWWPANQGGHWNDDINQKTQSCAFTGGVPLGTFTGAAPLVGVALQPEYLIEYFQRGHEKFFRITARGFGLTTDAQVVLQNHIGSPF